MNIAIITSKFNSSITKRLLEGANNGLEEEGISQSNIITAWVPGSYELPLAAKAFAETGKYSAIICLGAIVKGETDHYHMIAKHASTGIGQASLETGVPIIFGVLTTENMDQAFSRSGGRSGNIGYNASKSAVEMVKLLDSIRSETNI